MGSEPVVFPAEAVSVVVFVQPKTQLMGTMGPHITFMFRGLWGPIFSKGFAVQKVIGGFGDSIVVPLRIPIPSSEPQAQRLELLAEKRI